MDVTNKVAIITGSARGLGKEFAVRLLQNGAKVMISDILEDVAAQTLKDLQEQFGKDKVGFYKCDVLKEEEFVQLWDQTVKYFGKPVDLLVNNAGVNTSLGWKKCMEIDVLAVLMCSIHAVKMMGKSNGNTGGRIINIASLAGLVPSPTFDGVSYFAAKAGVVALSKCFGYEQEGIHVSCLCPSFAKTDIIADKDVEEFIKEQKFDVMPVSKVGEAFMTLLKHGKTGSALVVMPDTPPFFWPLFDRQVMIHGVILAKLMQKLFPDSVTHVTPLHQLLFFVFLVALMLILFYIFLCIIF